MKHRMQGFQKRSSNPGEKNPRLARISYHENGASCSCGWGTPLARMEVLEDRIDRHLNKRHNGQGIRF